MNDADDTGSGGRRSLAAATAAALPTLGGGCCVAFGLGSAGLGAVGGTTLAWVSTVATPVALIVAGMLLVRLSRPHARWRRWHGLTAVAAGSYLAAAFVVLPLAGLLVGPTGATLP